MKSEEATEAGAAVVLLATAGGGPSPKPLAAAAAPLARSLVSPSFLRLPWQRVRQEQSTLQLLHAEKGPCAGEGAGSLPEGGGVKRLFQRRCALHITQVTSEQLDIHIE